MCALGYSVTHSGQLLGPCATSYYWSKTSSLEIIIIITTNLLVPRRKRGAH